MNEPSPAASKHRTLVWVAFAGVLVAAIAALAGCPATTTTTAYTPITGVYITSSELYAGLGCGPAPGQLYRYAAVLSYGADGGADGQPIATDVFDCFSDGLFENLPVSDGGSLTFFIRIYAWNSAGFPASLAICTDGGPCGSQSAAAVVSASQSSPPQWTTTCTATQQPGVPVVAVCGPLVAPVDAGGVSDTGSAVDAGGAADEAGLLDATSTADATAAFDAGSDAGGFLDAAADSSASADAEGAPDALDVGEASAVDAPAPLDSGVDAGD